MSYMHRGIERGHENLSSLTPYYFIYLFIYFWLCWVSVAVCRFSLVGWVGGSTSLWYMSFSLQWLLLFWSMGSRHTGSVVERHGLHCPVAYGNLPGPEIKPMSPALAGGFLTIGLLGKSSKFLIGTFLFLFASINTWYWDPVQLI